MCPGRCSARILESWPPYVKSVTSDLWGMVMSDVEVGSEEKSCHCPLGHHRTSGATASCCELREGPVLGVRSGCGGGAEEGGVF